MNEGLSLIANHCNEFLSETHLPLVRELKNRMEDFTKVKVRHRDADPLTSIFNRAFSEHLFMAERAVFVNKNRTTDNLYFIFPVNGYRVLYSKEVMNSRTEYNSMFMSLKDELGKERTESVIVDLLKMSYTNKNVSEGIGLGCEIIIHNIPFFYGVRTTLFKSYDELLKEIELIKWQ